MRKSVLSSMLIMCFFWVSASAQSIDLAKQLYQEGDYQRAARIFEQLNSQESNLFTGKSYFALGQFLRAHHYLDNAITMSTNDAFTLEARYTKALNNFQLKNYTSSLEEFFEIKRLNSGSVFVSRSESMYDQILNYLSLKQVFQVFQETVNDDIRFDLLTSSIGKFSYSQALTILRRYKSSTVSYNPTRLAQIETALSDSITYGQQVIPTKYFEAPYGMTYRIGVALPEFDLEAEEYEISQHLYFGIQLAVEEFNEENRSKKIFLSFKNTNSIQEQPENLFDQLVWEDNIDAVIGPLFSETAVVFSNLAEQYEVPMLTPLANSDALNLGNKYVFQFNPTFSVRGKRMAQYAVNTLGLDTLAILAEKNSLGEASARAFRNEAEELGAFIKYFFLEDLESTGYSILEYTNYFSQSDTLEPAKGLKGIYAPFTGAVAPALVSALLTDLEASRSDYVLLGSEEWRNTDLSVRRLPETSIYYTQSFDIDYESIQVEDFSSRFRLRFQAEPNQFAFIGYDVASLLFSVIERVENPAYLKEGLRELSSYRGFTSRVRFSGEHINQNISINSIIQVTEEAKE